MKAIRMALIGLLAIPLAACGFTTVDEGERVVWTEWGVATGTGEPGFHTYNPISTDAITFNVLEQKRTGETEAYTKDVQNAGIKYTLTYALDSAQVLDTYTTIGVEWEAKLVDQNVERAIKDVIGTKEAVADVINKRSEVQDRIESVLRARLAKQRIRLASFELTDVTFAKAFENAVEAKQVAVEKANAAKNRTVEIEERARQKVIAATAEAEAIRIQSAALKGSPDYVKLKAVEAWGENGAKVPHTVVGGQGQPGVFLPQPPK